MKSFALLASAMLALTALPAQASEALAEDNNCLGCHSVEEKVVGPAFKDVAAKYKGQKNAAAMLADKVRKGGSGVWGTVAMPPNPKISDKDLKKVIAWVLAQGDTTPEQALSDLRHLETRGLLERIGGAERWRFGAASRRASSGDSTSMNCSRGC